MFEWCCKKRWLPIIIMKENLKYKKKEWTWQQGCVHLRLYTQHKFDWKSLKAPWKRVDGNIQVSVGCMIAVHCSFIVIFGEDPSWMIDWFIQYSYRAMPVNVSRSCWHIFDNPVPKELCHCCCIFLLLMRMFTLAMIKIDLKVGKELSVCA